MNITKRQQNIISDITNFVGLDLDCNNEKAFAVLTNIIDELFTMAEPNVIEYKTNYNHYLWLINIVFDYLAEQDKTIKRLIDLTEEYCEISRNNEK